MHIQASIQTHKQASVQMLIHARMQMHLHAEVQMHAQASMQMHVWTSITTPAEPSCSPHSTINCPYFPAIAPLRICKWSLVICEVRVFLSILAHQAQYFFSGFKFKKWENILI